MKLTAHYNKLEQVVFGIDAHDNVENRHEEASPQF
jgi:hypothetical protein